MHYHNPRAAAASLLYTGCDTSDFPPHLHFPALNVALHLLSEEGVAKSELQKLSCPDHFHYGQFSSRIQFNR